MSCYKTINGQFEGVTGTICDEMVASLREDDCYADCIAFDPDGSVNISGSMSYGTACNWDDMMHELALRFGLAGRFNTACDGDTWKFYVGTPKQQRDMELEYLNEQCAEMQKRINELNAMTF